MENLLYKVIDLIPNVSQFLETPQAFNNDDLSRILNQSEYNGWELVSLDANNRAVFYRAEPAPTDSYDIPLLPRNNYVN